MSFWRKCCCCIQDNEINVDETTRLLPTSDSDNASMKKVECPFTMLAFGVYPPGLHMRVIPNDFSKLGITKLACGAEHILMLSESNFVMAAGNNEYGQCARNPLQPLIKSENEAEIINETPINLSMTAFNIDKFKILDIAAGSYHSLVLVKAENSYNSNSLTKAMAFGHPMGCGFPDNSAKFVPTEVQIEQQRENIEKIYAGSMRSAAVTDSGKVFVWGEWFTGTKQIKPKELTYPRSPGIKKLAIGKMSILALTGFGKVFVVGDNTYGELGLARDIKSTLVPLELQLPFNTEIIDVGAGARHGMVLTRENRLFSFGDNSEGQLGVETARSYCPSEVTLKAIINTNKAEKVFCGDSHSAIVTSDGELYTWGDNTAGRLGIKGSMSVFRPRIVEETMGKFISHVACGGLFTAVLVGPAKNSINNRNSRVEELIPP